MNYENENNSYSQLALFKSSGHEHPACLALLASSSSTGAASTSSMKELIVTKDTQMINAENMMLMILPGLLW